MPTTTADDLWKKDGTKPRHRKYRITWPDDEKWKEDPLSKVFVVSVADADVEPPEWKELGRFSTKGEAQKAADADLGVAIPLGKWK